MDDLRHYLGRLRSWAGAGLYVHLLATAALGLFDGVGLYLLVPMLGLLGLLGEGGGVPLLGQGLAALRELPDSYALPLLLAVYVAVVGVQALLQRVQSIRAVRLQQGFIRHLRLGLYEGLMRANWPFFGRRRNSDIHHLLTSELARVSQATHLLLQLASSLAFTIVQIGIAFWLSAPLTGFALASGALIAFAMRRKVRRAKAVGNETSELSQSFYAGINDHFAGIKDIKSNRLEASFLSWFGSLTGRMEANFLAFARLQATTRSWYQLSAAALIAVFVLLAVEVLHVGAGQLLLVVIIFARLWPRFTTIQAGAEQLLSAAPALRGLRELERDCAAAREPEATGASDAMSLQRGLECRYVYYRYGTQAEADYALRDVSIRIPAGRMTAIVGRSGAGKSTLAELLMGLLEPERGVLLADGVPVSGETRLALRHSVGYVSQEPFLFHDSIRHNLLCVRPDASEEELWEALRFAAADEFVSRLPEGLDTVVGDRGCRLSGGERQRLVLARAIVRKPSILVLDEATSALDSDNEERIREALDRLRGTMTIVVIAHRLSTIRGADQVIAMERGEASVSETSIQTEGTGEADRRKEAIRA
ncbi:ABC transporter ATP-binding protein [Cohnella fermenti]|uniref:ABC transporter ATP-binding protein n=1 Tax=Cohnella fermenti TaxID=2565925 RepID=A0A4S4BI79_9BACL|nr:ABC transporter ATP-binding protein [Cohnella fermenti]THF73674.1 ABC transporter ATP-binding protein [Cohnella fermenti]